MFRCLAVLIAAISTMTGAQSCRVDLTLIALASMLATLGFTVHVYKHTREAALRKWLLPLIFFLAFVIAVTTLAVVVCLKKAGGAFRTLRRDIGMGLLGDLLLSPSSLAPARA
jgi:hypothetical protein